MKKIFILLLLISIMLVSSFLPSPLQQAYAKSISDNAVLILTGKMGDDNTLVIKVNLTSNTGISAMTLLLDYDNTAMVLTDVVFGDALASLEPITTNTKTEKGFAITPFKFNYLGYENDSTTGLLFTLTFKIFENIQDGDYRVALKYNKDKDLNYYDVNNEVKTKNCYIDNTEITIKNNSVVKVSTIVDDEKPNVYKILLIVFISFLAIVGAVVITYKIIFRKRRNWKKL